MYPRQKVPNFTNEVPRSSNKGSIANNLHISPKVRAFLQQRSYYRQHRMIANPPLEVAYRLTPNDIHEIRLLDAGLTPKNLQDVNRELQRGIAPVPVIDRLISPKTHALASQKKMAADDPQHPQKLSAWWDKEEEEVATTSKTLKKQSNPLQPKTDRKDSKWRTWRDEMATAPMKFQVHPFFKQNDLTHAQDMALCGPGIMVKGGHINQKNIDVDTSLRPASSTARSGWSHESYFDTCIPQSFPEVRAGPKEEMNTSFYQAIPFMGMGAGQGNMRADNATHFAESTRGGQSIRNITEIAIDRFYPLPRPDYMVPQNVVEPFPRAGADTRNADKYSRQQQYTQI
jgi:hypothetical protein